MFSFAAEGKILHKTTRFKFEQVNEYLELMRANEVVARAVMTF